MPVLFVVLIFVGAFFVIVNVIGALSVASQPDIGRLQDHNRKVNFLAQVAVALVAGLFLVIPGWYLRRNPTLDVLIKFVACGVALSIPWMFFVVAVRNEARKTLSLFNRVQSRFSGLLRLVYAVF